MFLFFFSLQVPCDCPMTAAIICEITVKGKNKSSAGVNLDVKTNVCDIAEMYYDGHCFSLVQQQTSQALAISQSFIYDFFVPIQRYLLAILHSYSEKTYIMHPFGKIEAKDHTTSVFYHIKIVPKGKVSSKNLPFHCDMAYFVCNISSQGVAPQFVCDGKYDCPHGEDEQTCNCGGSDKKVSIPSQNCLRISTITEERQLKPLSPMSLACDLTEQVRFVLNKVCLYTVNEQKMPDTCLFGAHLTNCSRIQCTNNFKCPHSYCIPHHYICNGRWDCPSGEDEETQCLKIYCPGFFHCKNASTCLHPSYVCNGIVDCSSKFEDDEMMCIHNFVCPFSCVCLGLGIDCHHKGLVTTPMSIQTQTILLTLSHNKIEYLPVQFFKSLSNLKFVNLSHNNISHLPSHTFDGGLTNLEQIDLGFNRIALLPMKLFFPLKCSALYNLILTNNLLEEVESWAFSGLMKLKKLDLSEMFLNRLHDHSFANISELKTLNLSVNKITFLCLDSFENTNNLLLLDLSNNPTKIMARYLENLFENMLFIKSAELDQTTSDLTCVSHDMETTNKSCTHSPAGLSHSLRSVLVLSMIVALVVIPYMIFISSVKYRIYAGLLVTPPMLTATNMFVHDAISSHLSKKCDFVFSSQFLCNSTKMISSYSLQTSFLNTALLAVDSFIIILFPFRRKGLSLKQLSNVIAITHLPFVFVGLHHHFSEPSIFYLFQTKQYEQCLKYNTAELHLAQIVLKVVVGFSTIVVSVLKSISAGKLLAKTQALEKESKLKRTAGVYSLLHLLSCLLFWVPVNIFLHLSLHKSGGTILSSAVLICTAISSITNVITYIVIKKDYQDFLSKMRQKIFIACGKT